MKIEELKLPQNPYASPEEVVEEERRLLPQRQALLLTQAGLGWMQVGAWCWLGAVVVGWLIFLGIVISSSTSGAYREPASLVWTLWLLAGLVPVAGLCSFPGTWRCSQSMGAGDEQGRAYIRISAICGYIGFMLSPMFLLAVVGMVLWMVSFWHWYRFLEYVAWKIHRQDLARWAFIMTLVVLGWLVLGLVTAVVGILGMSNIDPVTMGKLMQVLLPTLCALPAVYLGLEIWVLRGLRREVGEMLNGD